MKMVIGMGPVGLHVNDIGRSVEFFTAVLGLQVLVRGSTSPLRLEVRRCSGGRADGRSSGCGRPPARVRAWTPRPG
ncbi:MAG: hypothetical protein ACYDHH_04470 [Solirubrobacteraceae bacterium]